MEKYDITLKKLQDLLKKYADGVTAEQRFELLELHQELGGYAIEWTDELYKEVNSKFESLQEEANTLMNTIINLEEIIEEPKGGDIEIENIEPTQPNKTKVSL